VASSRDRLGEVLGSRMIQLGMLWLPVASVGLEEVPTKKCDSPGSDSYWKREHPRIYSL